MRNLTLRQLRSITAIHRHGKIVMAASELGLTPPAVSLQLQQIERETGLTLFDRTPDGMRVEPAPYSTGEMVVPETAESAGCTNGLLSAKGVGLGAILGFAALALSAIGSRRAPLS